VAGRDNELTLHEAATRLGVHYMTAYRYVRLGRLAAEQHDGRWWVRESDVDALATAPRTQRGRRGRPRWSPYRDRLDSRLLAGDDAGAWAIVEDALVSAADPTDVYVDVIGPVLRRIGDRWARGSVSVAEEHRATAAARRVIGRVGPRFSHRGRSRGPVVLGCAPGDRHELPLVMLADVLEGAGFDVVDLGADTPTESFVETAHRTRCRAIGISASTDAAAAAAQRTIRLLHREFPNRPILTGGPAVPTAAAASALGADGWAPDARAAVTTFTDLIDASA
jgi:excisionase family DNA binding protein